MARPQNIPPSDRSRWSRWHIRSIFLAPTPRGAATSQAGGGGDGGGGGGGGVGGGAAGGAGGARGPRGGGGGAGGGGGETRGSGARGGEGGGEGGEPAEADGDPKAGAGRHAVKRVVFVPNARARPVPGRRAGPHHGAGDAEDGALAAPRGRQIGTDRRRRRRDGRCGRGRGGGGGGDFEGSGGGGGARGGGAEGGERGARLRAAHHPLQVGALSAALRSNTRAARACRSSLGLLLQHVLQGHVYRGNLPELFRGMCTGGIYCSSLGLLFQHGLQGHGHVYRGNLLELFRLVAQTREFGKRLSSPPVTDATTPNTVASAVLLAREHRAATLVGRSTRCRELAIDVCAASIKEARLSTLTGVRGGMENVGGAAGTRRTSRSCWRTARRSASLSTRRATTWPRLRPRSTVRVVPARPRSTAPLRRHLCESESRSQMVITLVRVGHVRFDRDEPRASSPKIRNVYAARTRVRKRRLCLVTV
eukprot:1196223-Prorocentrum_minimum.AAC.3